MPSQDYSSAFLAYNQYATKQLVVAVAIEGVSQFLSSAPLERSVNYGDSGIFYGTAGLEYGETYPVPPSPSGDDFSFFPYLELDKSNLTIQQKIEPEQGRASISLLTLSFIDKDGFMSRIIASGPVVNDILGKQVRVYIGFKPLSFPEEYTIIFRGRISAVTSNSGSVELQLSDPNMVRRQQIFYAANSVLTTNINDSQTTLSVVDNSDFNEQVIGPDGGYDPAIKTYLKIDDEYIEYPPTGFGANIFTDCFRGARGTTPATHEAGAEVDAYIQVQDDALIMALKIMLSGWGGPYLADVKIRNLVDTDDPILANQPEGIILPFGIDAKQEYGLAPGDYITISDAVNPANDGACRIVTFLDIENTPNNVIITDKTFVAENGTTATMDLRSQYDTYPNNLGLRMPPYEVDVERHQYLKNVFFGGEENSLRFFTGQSQDSGKVFLESQVYLPLSCYSLTRFGRCSVQFTHPPLADQLVPVISGQNVINPDQIKIQRGINTRKFFNEVQYKYDYNDDGVPIKILLAVDTNSLNIIGIASLLPIEAQGLRSDLTPQRIIDQKVAYFLSRYATGAVILTLKVNFTVGILIEAGDTVIVQDDGILQISNFLTGAQNLGTQLFEVIDRSLDLRTGQVSLQLIGGTGSQANDRFGTVAPSTIIGASSTQTVLELTPSFGAQFGTQEYLKWIDYKGLDVLLHNTDYSTAATATIASFDFTNRNLMSVVGLGISPSAGMTLDLAPYPTNDDANDQAFAKLVNAYLDYTGTVAAGSSQTEFTVAASSIANYQVGFPLVIHNANWSIESEETTIAAINTGTSTITTVDSLGIIPASGQSIEINGFADGGLGYRLI